MPYATAAASQAKNTTDRKLSHAMVTSAITMNMGKP
jgi:hypothetical protein